MGAPGAVLPQPVGEVVAGEVVAGVASGGPVIDTGEGPWPPPMGPGPGAGGWPVSALPPPDPATRLGGLKGPGIRGGGVAAVGIVAGIVASLVAGLGVAVIVVAVAGGDAKTAVSTAPVLIASEGAMWAVWLAAAMYASKRNGTGSLRDDFGLKWPRAIDWPLGIGSGFAGRIISGLVAAFALGLTLGVTVPGAMAKASTSIAGFKPHGAFGWIVIGVITCLGAPFFEELFFRGLLQGALIQRWGALWGLVVTALIFSVAHVADEGLLAPLILLPMGLILGRLRQRTGSLAPGMIAHSTFNTLAFGVLLYQTGTIHF